MVTTKCACCWESDVSLFACTEGHLACSDCLQTGIQILVNETSKSTCISGHCSGLYTDKVLNSATINKKLVEKYNLHTFVNMLEKTNLSELYQCPFCPNRVVVYDNDNTIQNFNYTFFCMDGCKRYSCMNCKRESHEGPCNIDNQKHLEDEQLTQKFLIVCCGTPFFRGDACNKVKCPKCKKAYCWICKKRIYNYDHFSNPGPCKLYGERPQDIPEPQDIHELPQRVHLSVRCTSLTKKGDQCCRMTLSANRLCHSHNLQ